MDTHNKRVNMINMCSWNYIGLTPDGSVDLIDLKNWLWIPFWLVYPEPTEADASWISETKLLITTLNIV